MRHRTPPSLAVGLVRLLLPPGERDFVLGDLEEEYGRRVERRGRLWAMGCYLFEGVRSAASLATFWTTEEGMMTGIGEDVRGGFRIFRREPGFALVVVLLLALGVGGASAVYSVLRGVVLSPLEFEEPDRVVMLWGESREYSRTPLTVGDYNDVVEGVEAFRAVTAGWGNTALLVGDGDPEQISVGWVTPEYFDVLGVQPLIGRALGPDDEGRVVISHGLWVRRWGADPDILGRSLRLPGSSFEIIGVLPADRNPNLPTFAGTRTSWDVWRLQPRSWLEGHDRSVGWLRTTARLRDGVTLAQAQAETDAFMTQLNRTVTARDGGTDLRINLIPAKEDLVGGVSRSLWILLAAVFAVLLIAASNVANLMLARGEARSAELAVRATLGGSRLRLVRQLVVESAVLAAVGGALGVGVASLGLSALLGLAPPALPRLEAVGLDWTVVVFALAATTGAALVFGVVPAFRSTRAGLAQGLGERRATPDRGGRALSRGLVVAEVALSLLLLTATGLLLRSLDGLSGVDLGFEPEGLVTFALEVPEWGDGMEETAATMTAYLERMRSVPGVESAAFTNRVPLGGGLYTGSYRSEEMTVRDDPSIEASMRWVTPDFFTTFGARLLAGRPFGSDDGPEAVIVDQRAAELAWPGESPLGRRVEISSLLTEEPHWAEIVGVVAPMKHEGVADPAKETVFMPMLAAAHRQNFHYAAVRVNGDPLAFVDPLTEAVRAVDANTVLARVRTMDGLVRDDLASTRFAGFLLTVFGVVALLLATVGLHGIMAHSVRRRTREIGIRVALGAERAELLRRTVGAGALLVGSGVVVGVALSLGIGDVLGSLLYDVEPHDPVTIGGAAVLMVMAGLTGAYVPARVVLRLDPATTLREE